ncbi:MAG: gliding motility-associated C-terminal domain-containing protein [Bacteroidia bacterium]|nr:gliding motility-associated C-terminal domain-containing protein [Bacteroidia bacterium]
MKNVTLLLFVFSFLNTFSQATEKKEPEICPIEFGTTFTINAEGSDDWKFSCNCPITEFKLKVFSRWGLEIFKADSLPASKSLKWDWKKIAAGTYYYTLNYTVENKGEPFDKSSNGSLTLITDPDKKGNREE